MLKLHCPECGNDGSDAEIILVQEVVGKLIVGLDGGGNPVTDGDVLQVEAPMGEPHAWCSDCGSTIDLQTAYIHHHHDMRG